MDVADRHAAWSLGVALMSLEQVYVFRAGSLGDTIVSLPAWKCIAQRHPGRPLHLITPDQRRPGIPDTEDVYRLTGRLGEVIRYDSTGSGLARTAAAVRQVGNGIVYCLMSVRPTIRHLRDFVFMRLVLGLKTRGVMPAIRLNRRLQAGPTTVAAIPEWQRLLACAGGDATSLSFPLLDPTPEAGENIARALAPIGTAPFLVACPGSKMSAKRWPDERYQAVFRHFLESHREAYVVLVGSPDERDLCQSIAAAHADRMLNWAGQLSLDESAALCSRAVCYLGNDTGAMHVAAAMGRPCVAVFSARDLRGKWDPFGSGHTVLREEPACRHCMLVECTTEKQRCLTMIDIESVCRALERCWRASLSPSNGVPR
jgi:heptosyltransferase-3